MSVSRNVSSLAPVNKEQIIRDDFKALEFDVELAELKLVRRPLLEQLDEHDVVIRVQYAGVCGTDLHLIDNHFLSGNASVIPGHEISGVVVSVGSAVETVAPGDEVVVNPNSNCGRCHQCIKGKQNLCDSNDLSTAIGVNSDGGWAEYCKVCDLQVFRLPSGLDTRAAVLCESLSGVAHAWDRIAPVAQGDRILLMGASVHGQLMAAILHHQGYRDVIISDLSPMRRQIMHKLETGYEVVKPDVLRNRRLENAEWGVNLAIDCSGSSGGIGQSVDWLKPGGRLLIFGVCNPDVAMSISPFKIFVKELQIIGSLVNPFTFPKALDWAAALGNRYLDYSKLGIQTFPLHEHKNALSALHEGNATQVVFQFGK